MNGTTAERALLASTAAAGAERTARAAIESLLLNSEFTEELRQFIDDLDACARATAKLADQFAARVDIDPQVWELIVATLTRWNLRTWERTAGASLSLQLALLDIVEDFLVKQPNSRAVDDMVSTVEALTDSDSLVVTHVLIGVAVHAVGYAGLNPIA